MSNCIRYALFGLITLCLIGGCGGPVLFLAGGQLSGDEVPFSAANVPQETSTIQLETRPSDPYSVNVTAVVLDRKMFVDPAADRRWYRYLEQESNIRLKIADRPPVYAARVTVVDDPEILEHFEADRIVMQIAPRTP